MHRSLVSPCGAAFLMSWLMAAGMASAQQTPLAAEAAPAAAASAPPPLLTLAAALSLAQQRHPSLAAMRYAAQASEGDLEQAGASPNPQLELLLEDTRRDTRTTTLQLSQPIELGGKRAARVAVAQRGIDQAGVAQAMAQAALRAEVTNAFHTVSIAQERLRLAQASGALSARATDAVSRRVKAGKVSPVEETRAQVAQAGVQVDLAKAQGAWRAATQRLGGLIGWRDTQTLALAPPSLDAAMNEPTDAASASGSGLPERWADTGTLAQARLEVAQRQAQLALERAQGVPDVTVTLGAKRPEEIGRHQLVLGLSMPLPVRDSNRGAYLAAARRLDQAQAELAAEELRVAADTTELTERLRASRVEVQALRNTVLPGAESALQAMVTGFELGKFGFLDTLDAQRTLFQAREQYLQALDTLYRTTTELERLTTPIAPATKKDHP